MLILFSCFSMESAEGAQIPVLAAQHREQSSETEDLMSQVDEVIGEATDNSRDETQMEVEKEKEVEPEKEKSPRASNTMEELCARIQCLGKAKEPVFRFRYFIITDRNPGEISYEHDGLLIEWIYINTLVVTDVVREISKLLDDKSPKKIIVWCFSHFIVDRIFVNEVYEALKVIRNRMREKDCAQHSLVFGDVPFAPNDENSWPFISTFNFYQRNINLSLLNNPLSISKVFLKKVNYLNKMVVKGSCWHEHVNNTGLGSTISSAGWDKVRRWFAVHLAAGMGGPVNQSTLPGKEEEPAPLYQSPGFKQPLMIEFLKAKGTYVNPEDRPVSVSNNRRTAGGRDDPLRPSLATIGVFRRNSTSSSASSGSRRTQYNRNHSPRHNRNRSPKYNNQSPVYTQAKVDDKLLIAKLERDVEESAKEIKKLKEDREKQRDLKRLVEDRLYDRLDKLTADVEWQSRDRRSLESKLSKAKDDYRYIKEERDDIRNELDRCKDGRASGRRN